MNTNVITAVAFIAMIIGMLLITFPDVGKQGRLDRIASQIEEICYDGVIYTVSGSGITKKFSPNGTVATCKTRETL